MHEHLLAQAVLPTPVKVCGMSLRPFSLGHELYLTREIRELSTTGEDWPSLTAAVLICCQSWEESQRLHSDWRAGLNLWLWKLYLRRQIKRKRMMFHAELSKFRAYVADGSLGFPISETLKPDAGPAPREAGSPFLLRLHDWLICHLRLSEAEAWDYPIGLAKMRWAAHWEQLGGLDVYNHADAVHDKFVEEMEARQKMSSDDRNGRKSAPVKGEK